MSNLYISFQAPMKRAAAFCCRATADSKVALRTKLMYMELPAGGSMSSSGVTAELAFSATRYPNVLYLRRIGAGRRADFAPLVSCEGTDITLPARRRCLRCNYGSALPWKLSPTKRELPVTAREARRQRTICRAAGEGASASGYLHPDGEQFAPSTPVLIKWFYMTETRGGKLRFAAAGSSAADDFQSDGARTR